MNFSQAVLALTEDEKKKMRDLIEAIFMQRAKMLQESIAVDRRDGVDPANAMAREMWSWLLGCIGAGNDMLPTQLVARLEATGDEP